MKRLGDWVQSNLGASIVGGLVVGVALVIGTRLIDDIPLADLTRFLIVSIATAIVLGLLVFSVFNRAWRGRTWGWIAGLRLTTTAQRERASSNASLSGYADGCESIAPEIKRLNALVETAETERDHFKLAAVEATDRLKSAAAKKILGTLSPGVPEVPNLPLPRPRWSIYQPEIGSDGYDEHDFVLRNAVRKSVAKRVRVDARSMDFDFFDGADWDDLSGDNAGVFRGEALPWAEPRGWEFMVTWYDENGEKDAHAITMPKLRSMTAAELGVF